MDIHKILTAVPINRTARLVTSQTGLSDKDTPLMRDELAWLVQRLNRKQRLLKLVLGIKNKRQHSNVTYKYRKGIKQYRGITEPRALIEYIRCGKEIQRLTDELAKLRIVRQFVADAENQCKQLMNQRIVNS